ncbi:YdaS family helix-turn-helix protein [Photobacterium damselae]|uniref:YdaS family helix-turn-helix protein n=1 Tax=Photobacterium damselae TaxID=38293 RepID=UPI001F1E7BD2|nr:YdaS family helix-turn-helix protein [Photobacterium damselae]UKA12957.1 helix-turn-helix domain-containing protein [Photobacterium damselae subsp. damselae]
MESQTKRKGHKPPANIVQVILDNLYDQYGRRINSGKKTYLAHRLKVSRSAVSKFVNRNTMPAKYAFDIQRLTQKTVTARQVCEHAKGTEPGL